VLLRPFFNRTAFVLFAYLTTTTLSRYYPVSPKFHMRLRESIASHNTTQTRAFGDYLVLWVGGPSVEEYSPSKVCSIA
jgi:hypothetical protein